ncbi:hypothetical protein Tco_0988695 [Tanacetum coccineum]|uniref:Uncharacterized protein n=1 Tax=Tanacetum coccineum TaxID=301880 RepID=A0ABQ5ERN1_9ASTR
MDYKGIKDGLHFYGKIGIGESLEQDVTLKRQNVYVIRFDLGMSSWVPVPLNVVGFSGCRDDTSGTRSSTSNGSVRTPRHMGVILNSECGRTPVRDVGQAMHSFQLTTTTTYVDIVGSLGASSSTGHTSKTGVIDVGSNSVNDGSSTRSSTSTGQPRHLGIRYSINDENMMLSWLTTYGLGSQHVNVSVARQNVNEIGFGIPGVNNGTASSIIVEKNEEKPKQLLD